MRPVQMQRLSDLRDLRCDTARAAVARAEAAVESAARAVRQAQATARDAQAAHGFAASQGLEDMVGRTTSAGAIAALSHRIDQLALVRDAAEADLADQVRALDAARATREAAAATLARTLARRDGWSRKCLREANRIRRDRETLQDDEQADGHVVRASRRTRI